MNVRRVVVTGLGALTPIGNSIPSYWEGLINGVSGAGPITRFDAGKFKTQFACEIKDYNPLAFFDRKEVRKFDPYAQYGMISADEAITDSGLDLSAIDLERAGVIWASGIGGLLTFQEEVGDFFKGDGTPRFNPFFIPKMIADITAGHISIKYGFKGPNFATVSACASSANAIIDAYNYIKWGKAEIFVCGGSEAAVNAAGVGGFNAMHAISTRNDDPATGSRPFDKDRDGFVIGEGAGALILEEYEHAKARGAAIYAEIIGSGLTADAYHMTGPHPEGDGARRAMKSAIDEAGLNPQDVEHINTHGTSTPLGDVAEVKAIVALFGEHAPKISINSTKSMTGHLLGAAGAIESIATILALKNGIIPPTINHFTDDPDIDNSLDFTFGKARERKIQIALSNTFGFGGHNASILFKKFND
ncbi:MAG: beta-ketoacyl-ACP synthase II [Lentimicrobium sp.]|jgi:3-oxoacyl-[acyl-carrier-protein] synthase II|nr:beta-ketoacyl-ACP synthase II [Lentimicrobium sp.]MDD2528987.1 beta-ketoacyl-ACP synthase II [Lentimicrobiaceae bacterium]MDD4598670.1 beta-ketoacyl-ACP synthase II [Lentimicrobiaceae bacterium]MDY0026751.1 beta-ketoacyl-ACP synthase II [Lentimicrobium sp.]HAH60167.1 beta-ketoacyl-[acyl-carrier-protein] synthase II [Bacteroidales bacterium]